ncbi:MAG: Excinuclease ABC, C subunit [uncultured bacterium (gcode 4)]|uniref:Excinuclease ABC, C subunit n=1 Tax=uncultured bacterium (gcode 4) TaxID=1234023 RepID=K2GYU9_9BACT|nr:MAG: Excinuclease ABC, C subunit [uncultured bacterium (gcode 4)]
MWKLYIIENPELKLYIWVTGDLDKRIKSHNSDITKDWTKNKWPWELIYTEEYEIKCEALKREKTLKSLKAWQRIKKILNINSLS